MDIHYCIFYRIIANNNSRNPLAENMHVGSLSCIFLLYILLRWRTDTRGHFSFWTYRSGSHQNSQQTIQRLVFCIINILKNSIIILRIEPKMVPLNMSSVWLACFNDWWSLWALDCMWKMLSQVKIKKILLLFNMQIGRYLLL